MAYSSGIGVGDVVEIISPTMLDKIKKDEVLMPTRLEVVGFLATDFSDVDSNVALVSLRRMRELYNLGEGTHAVILRLSDGVDCTKFARELQAKLKYPFRVSTWLTSNEAFLRCHKNGKSNDVADNSADYFGGFVFDLHFVVHVGVAQNPRDWTDGGDGGKPRANRRDVLLSGLCNRRIRSFGGAGAYGAGSPFPRTACPAYCRQGVAYRILPFRAFAREIRVVRRAVGVVFFDSFMHSRRLLPRDESRRTEILGGHEK